MSALTITPPSTWPITAPQAITAEYSESARARPAPENVRWMRLITWGIISAAAAPWMSRKVTSEVVFGASPQASEATVKPARPSRNARPCPKRSPRRAPVTSSTA